MIDSMKKKLLKWLKAQYPSVAENNNNNRSYNGLSKEEQCLLMLLKENVFDMDVKETSIFIPTYQWNIVKHTTTTSNTLSIYTFFGSSGTYLQDVHVSIEIPSDIHLDKMHEIRNVCDIRKVYCNLLKDEHQRLALQAVREALSECLSKIARNRERDRKKALRYLYTDYTGKQYTDDECVLDMLTIKEKE